MDAYFHSLISVKHWGGKIEDYYPIHDLIDSTKELCSDNRHRILHTIWGVRRVIIPIFGSSITNSEGKTISVKDLCEKDHLLIDYQNRFIPTLNDFVQAMNFKEDISWKGNLENFHKKYANDPKLSELLLSPLASTGQLKSLLITHNSWFLNEIVPKILGYLPSILEFELSPFNIYESMKFELWMDNGMAIAPSARIINKSRIN
jgi:hypothetical protein